MSTETTETDSVPETAAKSIVQRIFRRDAALWVTTMVTVIAAAVYAQATVEARVDRRIDAGMAPVLQQMERLDGEVKRHEAESARVHLEIKDDLHELQADIRALYKAVQTGQPQPRLETHDGGAQ